MICPQCGWTGDIGSEAHRTFIHPAAAPVTDAGLREALKREIHHAIDNGHVITDGQGIAPGERVPAVRIDYLRAALARQAEKETA